MSDHFLSENLRLVRNGFAEFCEDDNLAGRTIDELQKRFDMLIELARKQEHELAVFRLMEANRIGRIEAEKLATGVMADALLERSGDVLRPNFRRRS